MRQLISTLAIAILALGGTSASAKTDNFPSHSITMIIPFAPGGASDFSGRLIAKVLAEQIKQSVIVENKSGAAGNIGMADAAKAKPDGYTLFLGNVGAIAINPSVFAGQLQLNPEKDFIAVTQVVDVADVLVVNASVPVSNVRTFIDYAKKQNGKLNFASPGNGSQNRLEMEAFKTLTGLKMTHIPYGGGAGQAMIDLIGGQTQVMFTTLPSAMPFVKSHRVKALAVTTSQRLAQLPDVPTLIESGWPTMVSSSWQGIFVPKGTPQPIVDSLFKAFTQVMKTKSLVDQLATGGVAVTVSKSPHDFSRFVANETQRWGAVVRSSDIKKD